MTKRSQWKGFFIGALVAVVVPALAATFNLFQPANGILKGNSSTYVTTAATSADVIATWTGTCNSSTFLRADGSCQSAGGGGGGSVTSVALTMPSGLSVGGSPVTTTGTLAVTTTLNGVVHGNGSGFTAGNVALASEVSGTLPVANGGTGATTISGVLKGNGTSAIGAAVAADVYGLWAGGCSSSNYLRGDGTCASPSGGSGTVTSVAAGTGITASPSPITTTGTLSVNQAFSPTWTGTHVFSGGFTRFANTPDEQIRISNDNGYISFYNTANSTRRGYLQADTANIVRLGTDTGPIELSPANNLAYVNGRNFAVNSASVANFAAAGRGTLLVNGSSAGALVELDVSNVPAAYFYAPNTGDVSLYAGAGRGIALTVNNNSAGVNISSGGVLSGNGSGLTSLNGSNISSGTVGVPVSTTTGAFSSSLTVAGQSVCQANGTNCPAGSGVKIAAADITVSGSSCTVSRAVANSPSCTYNSAGNYTVTFTSGFFSGNTPVCMANAWNGGTGRSATTGGLNSNAVNVGLRDLAGNPQDGGFAITCFGT